MKRQSIFLFNDTRGNVLMMTAFAVFMLMGLAGASIDLGRMALVKLRVQQGIDAAAIAVAKLPDTASQTEMDMTANRYFRLNFSNESTNSNTYLGATVPNISASRGNGAVEVSVGTVAVPTFFLSFVGLNNLSVDGRNKISTASTATGSVYDMYLVMDNSGSMASCTDGSAAGGGGGGGGGGGVKGGGGRNNVMNDSLLFAKSNVDILGILPKKMLGFLGATSHLIPQSNAGFSTALMNGLTHPLGGDAVTGSFLHDAASFQLAQVGLGCTSKINALKANTTALTNNLLSINGPQPNQIGGVSWDTAVLGTQDLTSDQNVMNNFLATMGPHGTTDSSVGLDRAYSMATGAHGFRNNTAHVVILLTDGLNNSYHGSIGADGGSQTANSNSATIQYCNQFKNMSPPTLVYTIAYGKDVVANSTVHGYLSSCATSVPGATPQAGYTVLTSQPNEGSYFFVAPDNATLSTVFQGIFTSVRKIKITQ